MHRSGIDHSHADSTDTTMFRCRYPATEVAGVGDNPFCIRQHLSNFVAKHLSPTLTFKKWKPDTAF
jgi:hypothetical protein